MKVKTVHYKRTKNLGNYENETFEMTAELDDSDGPLGAALQLQEYVLYMLGIDADPRDKKKTIENNEKFVDF